MGGGLRINERSRNNLFKNFRGAGIMNEQEVKEAIWKDFLKFMEGQTVSINKDNSTNFYEWDVERYKRC